MKKFLQTPEIAKQISIITFLICFIFVGNLFAETNREATSNKSFVEIKDNGVLAWSFDKQNNSKPEGKPTRKIADKLTKDYNNVMIPLESYPCTGEPDVTTVDNVEICPGFSTEIGITGLSLAEGYTYQWKYSSEIDGIYEIATGISTNTTYNTPTTLPANPTYYKCEVTCSHSGLTTASNPGSVSVKSFIDCYCDPLSATAPAATTGITGVQLNGNSVNINSTSPAGTSVPAPYYTLFETPVADLTVDLNYTVSVRFGQTSQARVIGSLD